MRNTEKKIIKLEEKKTTENYTMSEWQAREKLYWYVGSS